jgi:hypothetical protein
MQEDTLQKLDEAYEEFPGMCAEGVPQAEIEEASSHLGIPFPQDYQEFLRRYGGGHTGSLSIAGLRRWKFATRDDWSVIEMTTHLRSQQYPGADRWVIFSDDGFGNPIGFDKLGRVWISDHDSCEFVCIEASFEDWIRRWALRIEPHRGEYIAQERWPDEILQRLRNR